MWREDSLDFKRRRKNKRRGLWTDKLQRSVRIRCQESNARSWLAELTDQPGSQKYYPVKYIHVSLWRHEV